jgi:hypothetical protein
MSSSYTVALAGGANVAMTTEELVSAFNVGMIKEETLIWREGVDEWAPLAEFASELGVSVKGMVPVSHLRSDVPAEPVAEPARPQDAAISFRPRRVATEREKAEALAREAHLKRAKECEVCGHVGRPFKVSRGSSSWRSSYGCVSLCLAHFTRRGDAKERKSAQSVATAV